MVRPLVAAGLSPPTRGNRREMPVREIKGGSIPAHAGEPDSHTATHRERGVYPRPRGGTVGTRSSGDKGKGLSPPTRGNRPPPRPLPFAVGSIPAHAGEPKSCRRVSARNRVYPRPRGGTTVKSLSKRGVSGLSPPTRGNRVPFHRARKYRRSIPAHAGEPRRARGHTGRARVYPRPRGGTGHGDADADPIHGLSPPTRGNPTLSLFAS